MNLLTFDHVSFQYENGLPILQDISLSVGPDESVGLIGANGAGKTTLMKMLPGLLLPNEGQVTVADIVVNKKNLSQARRKVGYVFQDSDSQLFMATAYDDVAFGPRNYGHTEEEVAERVLTAMEQCGCLHLKDKQIYKMSGGEKKLVSLATVMAMRPRCLLLDEPSVALDPRNRRNLISLLNSLPVAKLIASHDLDMIWDTCGRPILIDQGKIIADGDTKTILQDKELLEAHGLELPLRLFKE
ncbi:MAG: energy-coupling factor ABC transporter ATP-binding protein [Lachnospiraceae bacterium]|nr:energy-coupling factor ABC transporter ATP-binding protein [Candidatus Equihabitans merdae]